MKTTISYWGILCLSATMFFFVSCSNNDDAPVKAARHDANETMSAPTYGNLRIINNTSHKFTQDLYAYNRTNYYGTNFTLWQQVTISPLSDVTLTDYQSTNSNGMDVVGNNKWITQEQGLFPTGSVPAGDASAIGDPTSLDFHMNSIPSNPLLYYVQWSGMESVFDSTNSVRLAFKLDYTQHFQPIVNPEQEHVHADGHYVFKTTGTIDADGLITIDIEDVLLVN